MANEYKFQASAAAPRIVGLVGPAGAGKSWTAAELARRCGYVPIHIGDPLKEIAMALGFERREVCGTAAEKEVPNAFWGISGRHFMQRFGTDVMRDRLGLIIPEMRDVWIQCFRRRAAIMIRGGAKIVVDGIRFQDEIDAIRGMGGKSYFVHRAAEPTAARRGGGGHISETRLEDLAVDGVLHNNHADGRHVNIIVGPPPRPRRVSPVCVRIVIIIAAIWGAFLYWLSH